LLGYRRLDPRPARDDGAHQGRRARPEGAAKGKILLFNHPFDKQLAAEGLGIAVVVLVRPVGGADYRCRTPAHN